MRTETTAEAHARKRLGLATATLAMSVVAAIVLPIPSFAEFIPLSPEQMSAFEDYLDSPEYFESQAPFALMECGLIASYSDRETISDRAAPMVQAGVAMAVEAHDVFVAERGPAVSSEERPLSDFYDSWSGDFSAGVLFAKTQDRIVKELKGEASSVDPLRANAEFQERNCMYLPLE